MIPEVILSDEYRVDMAGTSDGSQVKFFKDGLWYKEDHFQGEGEAEHLISLVQRSFNLSEERYVYYDRIMINGKAGCVSSDFLKEGESLVSFYRLYQNTMGGDLAQITSRMDYDERKLHSRIPL